MMPPDNRGAASEPGYMRQPYVSRVAGLDHRIAARTGERGEFAATTHPD
jgi:hypothetical protein